MSSNLFLLILFDHTLSQNRHHQKINNNHNILFVAHFYLTALLVKDQLLQRDSRIVNVSCHAYLSAKMTLDDPLNQGKWAPAFHARDAFAHSKLATVMASRELSDRLKRECDITI